MNTGNITNDEADKIANFITGFKLIHSNTPVNQLITDIRTKDFAVFNEKHCEPYIEMEKQLIIETFKYAQILHAMGDEMRAEQYYYNLTNK
jgi:hypothetical protein